MPVLSVLGTFGCVFSSLPLWDASASRFANALLSSSYSSLEQLQTFRSQTQDHSGRVSLPSFFSISRASQSERPLALLTDAASLPLPSSSFDGFLAPGEMCLVLGRPGSGCSSFLQNISNQRDGFMSVEGDGKSQ